MDVVLKVGRKAHLATMGLNDYASRGPALAEQPANGFDWPGVRQWTSCRST